MNKNTYTNRASIFRRISAAFKRQDWLSIAIDTFMVIFSVLVALQLSNWNEERTTRADEQAMLNRLKIEFTLILRNANDSVNHLRTMQSSNATFVGLVQNDMQGIDAKTLSEKMATAFNLPLPPNPSAAFAELLASGRLNILDDQLTRVSLIAYNTKLQSVTQSQREWARPYLEPMVRFLFLIEELPLNEAFTEASNKTDLLVAAQIHESVFAQQLVMFEDLIVATEEVLATLYKQQGRAE